MNNTARSEISSQQVATENPTASALNREDQEVSQLRGETPKQIPVIMNNRFNSKKPAPVNFGKPVQRREPMTHSTNAAQRWNDEKILLLGESIISGINTKGLVKGLHKNSKGGATLQHMIDEVSVYDMKVFSTVILYISGNEAANGKSPEWIEEKFDELINLIKSSNNDCRVILCLLAPRGDVGVTRVNQSITKLANKWNNRSVEVSTECYDVFFKGGQLTHRYFNQDGVHLSCSGTKRLLDARKQKMPFSSRFQHVGFQQRSEKQWSA